MAGELDPEEWTAIMNRAFERLIAPVYRHEGMVARLMGDGILAFFGAPIAHEDDPQRAVLEHCRRAAEVHRATGELRQWGWVTTWMAFAFYRRGNFTQTLAQA